MTQEIVETIWREKYRYSDEASPHESNIRICKGVYASDPEKSTRARIAVEAMDSQEWCPAGRIHAGAGTPHRVTLINCYVSPIIADSIDSSEKHPVGIMDALKVAAKTQQMGGGIGMDFSTIRPAGAILTRTGSTASGPVPFMGMWDSMCRTIMSSGARRGAMMATMSDDHPDIFKFIHAKKEAGVLTNFNVSVLVSDDLMRAVAAGTDWQLGFHIPKGGVSYENEPLVERDGKTWYVYETVPARELWDAILTSTYNYAEPGVIFIDQVNRMNNLNYCENIRCTNPCGEQPLPPNGDCNLGAVNLAVMVNDPFGADPTVKMERIRKVVKIAVRFLDNVLDVTLYPTLDQELEAKAKRRIGLGITGLGNMLQQMKLHYDSDGGRSLVVAVMKVIRDTAYSASVDLAQERGPFPEWKKEYVQSPFIQELPNVLKQRIGSVGTRNSVILTIAPTGTTSIYYGNVSSGIEPTFAWSYERRVRAENRDEDWRTFDVMDYGYLKYQEVKGEDTELASYMVTALELPVTAHVLMQAVCQEFVDASISKTINCPKSMTYEEFRQVYKTAYELGLKGCTTYRPSDVRGSILMAKDESPEKQTDLEEPDRTVVKAPRPELLEGKTYKCKWGDTNYYVTINDEITEEGRKPFELFINSKSAGDAEWVAALTRMISAIFRRGGHVDFLSEELEQVYSATGGQWIEQKYVPSKVAMLGGVIRRHLDGLDGTTAAPVEEIGDEQSPVQTFEICPSCNQHSLIRLEGCDMCIQCDYSTCG